MKKLLISFLLVLSACVHQAPQEILVGLGDTRDDREAIEVQRLMMQVLVVKTEVDLLFPSMEKKCPKGLECTSPIPETLSGTGSGVVVGTRDSKKVVLTAGHVCSMPEYRNVDAAKKINELGKVLATRVQVVDYLGHVTSGHVFSINRFADSCLIVLDGATRAPVSDVDFLNAPIGATVENVSVPLGFVYDKGFWYQKAQIVAWAKSDDPKFADNQVLNLPTVGGHSGSGVFYKKKLVGLMRAVEPEFHHLSYMVPIGVFRWQIEEVLR